MADGAVNALDVIYVSMSVTATCFIVPSSFNTTLSASTIVVEEALVPPSMMFNSAPVAVRAVPPNFKDDKSKESVTSTTPAPLPAPSQ